MVRRASQQDYLIELRLLLANFFSSDELRTLCFDLGMDYDDLPGEGRVGKARELIAYLDRHGQLSELVEIGGRQRPDIPWPQLDRRRVEFTVQVGDICSFDADVIALKFAQNLYGADSAVATALGKDEYDIGHLVSQLGQYTLISSDGGIVARHALFVSVPPLHEFGYAEVRELGAQVLSALARASPTMRHLAMTIHGVNYSLDEAESLRAQLAGYLDAFDSGRYPQALERITIVDIRPDRVKRLQLVLASAIPEFSVVLEEAQEPLVSPRPVERSSQTMNVGRESASKPHIFVAMPFVDDWQDTYHYGIERSVHANGYLCERLDFTTFTGDILGRIKERIETASFVIAELTAGNQNVFLEVGYAWGKERPTILLTRDTEGLPFDVTGQKCIVYSQIHELEQKLTKELQELKNGNVWQKAASVL